MIHSRLLRGCLTVGIGFSLLLSGSACSAFQPKTQAVTITATQPNAEIWIDGVAVGRSPVTKELQRNKSHSVMAKYAGKTGTTIVERSISTTGVLDIVGTCIFLVPVIGLFTPGFWELDPTDIHVDVK